MTSEIADSAAIAAIVVVSVAVIVVAYVAIRESMRRHADIVQRYARQPDGARPRTPR